MAEIVNMNGVLMVEVDMPNGFGYRKAEEPEIIELLEALRKDVTRAEHERNEERELKLKAYLKIDELEQNVCDSCLEYEDDGTPRTAYGWNENREEGQIACACISESGPYQVLQEENESLKKKLKVVFDNGVDDESERWAKRLAWLSEKFEIDCSGLDSGDLLDGVEYTCQVLCDKLEAKQEAVATID